MDYGRAELLEGSDVLAELKRLRKHFGPEYAVAVDPFTRDVEVIRRPAPLPEEDVT